MCSRSLDVLALGAQLGDDLLDALLVDDPQALPRDAQPNEALLVLEPETLRVQVRQKPALRLVVRVGNLVPDHRPFAGDFADPRHGVIPKQASKGRGLYPLTRSAGKVKRLKPSPARPAKHGRRGSRQRGRGAGPRPAPMPSRASA